ncbi:MAG TPA: SPOR domain-containing protein [Candidatus Krumholzibacteria bacterium]|nr:SPOR domain-containing protein [Candidatus Krumholzibacteria bacterium]
MRIAPHFIAALAAAATITACATAPPSGERPAKPAKQAPVERASKDKPYDFRSEGQIPPLKPDDAANEPDVQEMGVSSGAGVEVTDAEAPPVTAPEAAPESALIDGFRVQVFATGDRDIAANAAREVQERLGIPTYVDLDGGMYKVRAGDFATRAEADQALPSIRKDYPDAWVVASKVRATQRP